MAVNFETKLYEFQSCGRLTARGYTYVNSTIGTFSRGARRQDRIEIVKDDSEVRREIFVRPLSECVHLKKQFNISIR